MKIITAAATLDELTAQIKLKLVENGVLEKTFNRNYNENSIAIGAALQAAKALVGHGQWQNWLTANFAMTDRSARNYMKLADYFGGNSTIKTEYVFRFQPYALLALTELTAAEVQKFLAEQAAAGVNLPSLSVRNLRDRIKAYKKEQVLTLEVEAVIADAPKKSPTKFYLPQSLIDAALRAGFSIALEFSRAAKIAAEVVVTKLATGADFFQAFMAAATAGIFTRPLIFPRSDGTTAKLKTCIWYFGSSIQPFAQEFSRFGSVFRPIKQVAQLQAPTLNLANIALKIDSAAVI